MVDVILSSGFLAFARHCGFLEAVEESALPIDGLCGVSSGALVASLWLAGVRGEALIAEVNQPRPITQLRPNLRFWRGLFVLDPVVERLRRHLPARFSDLPAPLGVGVIDAQRQPRLITEGPLPEAVAASCAVPFLFAPIRIGGRLWADGGAVDRTMFGPWRAHRGARPTLLHLVSSSSARLARRSGFKLEPDPTETGTADLFIAHTPRSGASLFSLGDFHGQRREALELSRPALARARSHLDRSTGPC